MNLKRSVLVKVTKMTIKKETTAGRQVINHGELVKSVQIGKDLVSIQVFADSDLPLLRAWIPKDRRKIGRDFAIVKRGNLGSPISQTSSTRKVLKKIAKRCAAMAAFIGRDIEVALWSRISYASYSALLAVHKGNIFLDILLDHHLEDFRLNLRPELYLNKNSVRLRPAEEPESEETESPAFRAASDVSRDDIEGLKDSYSSPNHNRTAILLNSISVIRRQLPEQSLGWPLLRRKSAPNQEFKNPEARDMSVEHNVEVSVSLNTEDLESYSKPGWPLLRITASTASDSLSEYEATKMPMVGSVANAPIQSTVELPPSKIALVCTKVENPVQIENYLPALRKMPNDLELRCKQFSLRELKQATSGFCPENLIGEGGSSNVYKGCLPGGKPVAVKILKSYKEAWSDFSLEVDIVSSLKHKHITPLIGVCVEDDHLISVYDFFHRGSLEEILHGQNKKSVLPWVVRFKVATAIAEALTYLHNECSPSVIHRDVKSSNILLSDGFQPQLSDFGLAIRGPMDSTYMIESNVVGTFGYIAPEYFMEGRVSDKTDVYSFGVVLLELVSGRRPISSKALQGQESFIEWARALLERRNLEGLVDPLLDGDFDVAQMHRMVLAASLCLNQLDRYRPKVSQALEVLRGDKEPREWCNFHATDLKAPNDQEVDDLSPEFVHKLYTYLSVPFKDDRSTSMCSNYTTSRCRAGKEHRLKLKDYLKKVQG
ncbi:receptor-like serine/threonine-protein kinase At3g01300 [Durio zibethinus]|uniref:Receptor-like serine/threonine-protein kinase At3g01300 n=1 Tax=Durio zibethinus TaxID=66656 RepID=A0A6P5ZPI6_DURZI|nr:receptor-like serine/threonine-protein kinase At3g01300 [Durio zibethinus]